MDPLAAFLLGLILGMLVLSIIAIILNNKLK